MNITVMYSCRSCDVRDEKVDVPARQSHEVNVVKWMEGTTARIGQHHRSRFPRCNARKLYDLKIPMDNAEWIGGPPIT